MGVQGHAGGREVCVECSHWLKNQESRHDLLPSDAYIWLKSERGKAVDLENSFFF